MAADATAGIIIIGNEILSGQFADENAAFLIDELRGLGVALRRVAFIPDEIDDIATTVADFSRRFDHVFTTGGVGPTHDDVTMAGIARAFGRTIVRHPELVELLRHYLGRELLEGHLRLAEVPEGAEIVRGEPPGSPVIAYHNVYILPGVPELVVKKFRTIAERFRCRPYFSAALYCSGDEATIAPALDAVVAAYPHTSFGSYPRPGEPDFRVLITVKSKDPGAAAAALSELRSRLGDLVVRVDEPR